MLPFFFEFTLLLSFLLPRIFADSHLPDTFQGHIRNNTTRNNKNFIFCQTLRHLFINCTHASSFWNRFQQWYSISSNTKLLLSELEVMFGIIRCHTYCLALNHLIILGKYFLYVNALNTIRYCFDDFVSLVRVKINLEKYIAVTCNKEEEFRNKWKFFLSL